MEDSNDTIEWKQNPKLKLKHNYNNHPKKLCETNRFTNQPIDIDYVIQNDYSKLISNAQAEAVAMAMNIFENNKTDRGFWLGDDVGVGKTRTLASIVCEKLKKSKKPLRVLWLVPNKALIEAAEKEYALFNEFTESAIINVPRV